MGGVCPGGGGLSRVFVVHSSTGCLHLVYLVIKTVLVCEYGLMRFCLDVLFN